MRRAHHYGKDGPSVAENSTVARMKVATAPLHTLTPAMLDSITNSHARRGTPGWTKLRDALGAMVEARRVNEREGRA